VVLEHLGATSDRNRKNAVLYRRSEKRVLRATLDQINVAAKRVYDRFSVRETDSLELDTNGKLKTVF